MVGLRVVACQKSVFSDQYAGKLVGSNLSTESAKNAQ